MSRRAASLLAPLVVRALRHRPATKGPRLRGQERTGCVLDVAERAPRASGASRGGAQRR